MKQSVKILLNQVTQWAESRPAILGVALVGSYARHAARAESDVDLVLLAAAPQEWIDQPEWIHAFGAVQSVSVEDWGLVTSLRVFYQDGPEVEFGLTSAEWASEPIDAGTRRVIADGMQILLDKTGALGRALNAVTRQAGQPTSAQEPE